MLKRFEKKNVINNLVELCSSSNLLLVVHYQGLSVENLTALRKKLYEVGGNLSVNKNRLMKIALSECGDFEEGSLKNFSDVLSGPTAVVSASEPVNPTKIVVDFAKNHEKLQLVGALVDGSFVDVAGINALSKMPSLDEIRGQIVGMVNAPATKLVRMLQTPATRIATVLDGYSKK